MIASLIIAKGLNNIQLLTTYHLELFWWDFTSYCSYYCYKRANLTKILHLENINKKKKTNFIKTFFAATLGSSTMHISAFIDTWLASMLISGSIFLFILCK